MLRTAAVLVCGAGLVVSAAMAQQDAPMPPPSDGQQQGPPPGGSHGMNPQRRAQMMQRRLDLTAEQTAHVQGILSAQEAKMEALRANTSLAPEDRRAQMKALHEGEDAGVRGVLSPDQQVKFDAMQAQMRERRKNKANEGAPPPPPPQQ